MTTVPAQKKTKVVHRPRCPHCRKQFRTTSTVKIYCTPQCQKESTKKKRRVTRVDRANNSAFFYHLAYECERAQTLQILTGHTVESLVALYDVYKLKLKANRYGETKDYEISHIHSVQGHDSMGLYHADNLVVAPSKLNREHGTQHYGHGLCINRNTLVSKHSVGKGAPRKQTVQRIIAFLGAEVVAEAVKVAKIQSTQRHKVLSWLHDHLDPAVPEQRAHLDNLDDMSGKALSALKAKLEGKEGGEFTLKTTTLTPFNVLSQELERHALHRPELTEVLDILCKRVSPFTSLHRSRTTLNDEELQAVFDVLHGKSVDAIRDVLTEFVERHTSVMDNGERIPSYKPIVFKPSPMQRPVRVLAVFKDFADCLDGEGLDVVVPVPVPVLAQAYAPQPVELLPWD